jgi:hypothetical protein
MGYAPGFLNCVDLVVPLPYSPRSNAAPVAVLKTLCLKGSWFGYSTDDPTVTTRTRGENWRPSSVICAFVSAIRAVPLFGAR